MERRFLVFLVLSFLLLMANALWNVKNIQPPDNQLAANQEAGDGDAANEGQPDANPEVDDDARAGGEGGGEADPDNGQLAEASDDGDAAAGDANDGQEREPRVEPQFVTLGSLDADSPYRMLVYFTNVGAAVHRIELSSERYLDLQDRSGYLGHMELADGNAPGATVRVVGVGTPADHAGLEIGDRIVAAGVGDAAPIADTQALYEVLGETKPGQTLTLDVDRDGRRVALTAKLRRRPLDVIRPESENVLMRQDTLPPGFIQPPSFLTTIAQVGDDKLEGEADELAGVDLATAAWRRVNENEVDAVTFERRLPELGLVVTKRYELAKAIGADPDDPAYHLTLAITIEDTRAAADAAARSIAYRQDGPNGLPVEGWWYAMKTGRTWGGVGIRDIIGRYFGAAPQQIGAATIAKGDAKPFQSGSMAYMGVDAQYFAVSMIPVKTSPSEEWLAAADPILLGPAPDRRTGEGRFANVTCRLVSKPVTLEPGASLTHSYRIFAGPKRPSLLVQYEAADQPAYTLSDYVYYGWFAPVARTMVGLLHVFYGFVGNYGLAIIMLTVLIRGGMAPLSRKQAKSMAKMQELKPEMERMKERYKGDQQKQAQAMQELYRKHNINPLAGCLPMLIQLPVFIGLWRGLSIDVELRQAPLISESVRWCSNLAAPDMFWNWSGFMPDFITRGQGIFGLGPYLNILPLVTVALFLWQQKLFTPEPTNEQAAMQQKIMKYMMGFIGLMFFKVASGLCIYSISSSLWGIAERKLIPPATANTSTGGTSAAGGAPGPDKRGSSPSAAERSRRADKNGRTEDAKRAKKAKRRR